MGRVQKCWCGRCKVCRARERYQTDSAVREARKQCSRDGYRKKTPLEREALLEALQRRYADDPAFRARQLARHKRKKPVQLTLPF